MARGPESLLGYLGAAARDARTRAGRKQIHIAVEADVDQGTVRRFEQGKHWPRDPDAMLAAYGRDLDIDPREIWAEAVKRWRDEASSRSS